MCNFSQRYLVDDKYTNSNQPNLCLTLLVGYFGDRTIGTVLDVNTVNINEYMNLMNVYWFTNKKFTILKQYCFFVPENSTITHFVVLECSYLWVFMSSVAYQPIFSAELVIAYSLSHFVSTKPHGINWMVATLDVIYSLECRIAGWFARPREVSSARMFRRNPPPPPSVVKNNFFDSEMRWRRSFASPL